MGVEGNPPPVEGEAHERFKIQIMDGSIRLHTS